MPAKIIDYFEAVLGVLNAGSYSEAFTAERKHVPVLEREELDALVVWVSPGETTRGGLAGGDTNVPATRGGLQHLRRFGVNVHLANPVSPTDKTDTDAMLLLTEEVEDELIASGKALLAGNMVAMSTAELDDDSVLLRNEFKTVITLEYQEAV